MNYGYARVSTDQQDYEGQLVALNGAGCAKVFAEKESGAKTERKALARAINALELGDCLIVTKLDRLARSTRDLLNTLDAVAKRGAPAHVYDRVVEHEDVDHRAEEVGRVLETLSEKLVLDIHSAASFLFAGTIGFSPLARKNSIASFRSAT